MRDREFLLQERYVNEEFGPWKVLVTCMMLNQTTWMQAEKALERIFERWPTPHSFDNMFNQDWYQLHEILRPLGLVERRSRFLVYMSRQFALNYDNVGTNWHKYRIFSFSGCGQYAEDAWTLFVLKTPCRPKDKRLMYYAKREGLYVEEATKI
jgi:endonuclease III